MPVPLHAPATLPAAAPATRPLELDPACVVVTMGGGRDPAWAEAVLRDGDTAYAVARADAPALRRGRMAAAVHGPVYRTGSGGQVAVPTGRITVRPVAGADPDALAAALAGEGFRVVRRSATLIVAEPVSGDVGAALGRLATVAGLPGIAEVAPQVLFQRVAKSPP